jgi:hypothetical protein
MKKCIVPVGLLLAMTLAGQKAKWQDACFNNPGAPYCPGHEYAVKKTPPPTTKDSVKSTLSSPGSVSDAPESATPSVIMAGGIDWRFVDPAADALLGFNFSGLSASPVARSLIAQLGAKQGLTEADIKKIFDGLSGVEQVAVSVRDGKMLVLMTGSAAATLRAPDAATKAAPVSGRAMLFGPADAVDQAMQRIAENGPVPELALSAWQTQANNEFWVAGSAKVLGEQAVSAGVKRFLLTMSIRNRISSDLAFEFNAAPSAKTIEEWSSLGAATVEGNTLRSRMSIEGGEARFGDIVASPAGERLAALVAAARYLPTRDTTAPKPAKPVIVNQDR